MSLELDQGKRCHDSAINLNAVVAQTQMWAFNPQEREVTCGLRDSKVRLQLKSSLSLNFALAVSL